MTDSWLNDRIGYINNQIKVIIDEEIKKKYKNREEKENIVKIVNNSLKHLTCYCCLDTKKQLFDCKSFFIRYYGEYTCFVCTDEHIRTNCYSQISYGKVNVNGFQRQIPYYSLKNKGIILSYLIELYKDEYQLI
jgi:hypothetical protein